MPRSISSPLPAESSSEYFDEDFFLGDLPLFDEPSSERTFRFDTRRSLSPSSYVMSNVPSELTRAILPLYHLPLPL